jgi:membrane-associated phospholipid phosphatase
VGRDLVLNTQARTLTKIKQSEWICLGLLLFTIILVPKDWHRIEFLLVLFIPVILSMNYFNFDKELLKKSVLFLSIYLIASYSTFILHVWQLKWEITNTNGLFGWQLKIDEWLYSIPFNDGMWLRQLAHPFLDKIFLTIYVHGFVLCLFVLTIYFLLTGQPNKIIHAMFAGFFLQYLLILPFHFWVDGHQVWLVQNQIEGYQYLDPLLGHRTFTQPIVPSLNHVFPSMHTSIATVAILIALREASAHIKYFFVTLNVAIIISTVYLGIHWVVDIIGGVIFGYLVFKLADRIMRTRFIQRLTKSSEREYEYERTHSM